MTTTPIQVSTDLSQVLSQINQKLDHLASDVADIRQKDLVELKVGQARLEERLTAVEKEIKNTQGDIKDIKGSQKNQIWSLIVILSGTLLGIAAKVFFLTGNP